MSTTLASGANTTITLPAGQVLYTGKTGNGVAVIGPGPQAGQTFTLGNGARIGPYGNDVSVFLTSNQGAIDYQIGDAPGEPAGTPVVMDPLGPTLTGDSVGAVRGAGALINVFAFGSSSTNYCTYVSGADSGARSRGYMANFMRRCGGRVRWIGTSGVVGENSADQLARLPGVIASIKSSGVLPDIFVLQAAANDTFNSPALTLAQTQANVLAMITMIRQELGAVVALMLPNQRPGGASAGQIAGAVAIAAWMLSLGRYDKLLRVANTPRYIADTTSLSYAAASGMLLSDNIHTSARGGDASGLALYEAVKDLLIAKRWDAGASGYVYDATTNPNGNRLPNPQLVTGTGGTGGAFVTAGTVPQNVTVARNAGTGTVAISKVARTDRPGEWTRLTFTMAAGDDWSIYETSLLPGVAGEVVAAVVETRTDTSAAGGNVLQCTARMKTSSPVATVYESMGTSATDAENVLPTYALREDEVRVVPASSFSNGVSVFVGMYVKFIGTGTFVLDIGGMDYRADPVI